MVYTGVSQYIFGLSLQDSVRPPQDSTQHTTVLQLKTLVTISTAHTLPRCGHVPSPTWSAFQSAQLCFLQQSIFPSQKYCEYIAMSKYVHIIIILIL